MKIDYLLYYPTVRLLIGIVIVPAVLLDLMQPSPALRLVYRSTAFA